MKKVLFIINSTNFGGAERFALELSSNINSDSIICYLTTIGPIASEIEKLNLKVFLKSFKKVYSLGNTKKTFFIFRLIKLLYFVLFNRINVIISNGQSPGLYSKLVNLILLGRIRVISVFHTVYKRYIMIEKILQFLTFRNVAVSNEVFKFLKSSYPRSNNILIFNGINIRIKKKFKKKIDNKFTFLTVGRIMPDKNYEIGVEIMNQLLRKVPNSNWIVVGGIDQNKSYFELIENSIDPSLIERIHFTGEVNDVHEYYSVASCLIHFSEYESFGLVFLEAAYYGIPIISKNVGILNDTPNFQFAYFYLDNNINQLIKTVDNIRTGKIVNNNKKMVLDHFSINRTASEYKNIILL